MEFNEFREKIKKVKGQRNHKVKGSLGVYDAYKYIRKNKYFDIGTPIKEKQFYLIIRNVSKLLAKEIYEGRPVKLPLRMGEIELRKTPTQLKIVDGQLVNHLPIDWDATLKLWFEDKECYQNRQLVRMDEKELFKISYNKVKAEYNNKTFYQFNANRDIKTKLKQNIKAGRIDAFLIGNYD